MNDTTDVPKSMTGLMDSIIKSLGATKQHKHDHNGAYAPKTCADVANKVLVAFPERSLKELKVLFYSRRAVISAKLEQKMLEDQTG